MLLFSSTAIQTSYLCSKIWFQHIQDLIVFFAFLCARTLLTNDGRFRICIKENNSKKRKIQFKERIAKCKQWQEIYFARVHMLANSRFLFSSYNSQLYKSNILLKKNHFFEKTKCFIFWFSVFWFSVFWFIENVTFILKKCFKCQKRQWITNSNRNQFNSLHMKIHSFDSFQYL